MADYFISYTSSDREWAHWIGKELAALSHTPHVHEWEIAGGDDIYAWMETRHNAADHVLCVVSDEYLRAPFSTLERNAALWQAAKNRSSFVLFVVVKPCRLPTLIDHIRRCELYGVAEEDARARFREFLSARVAPPTAFFPGQVFALSNIPVRAPTHFMGREQELAAIAAALDAAPAATGGIAALYGMRGVGKTALAAVFAERRRSNYRATWWVRAQSEESLRADLVALGVRLGWATADDKEEPALALVMERLRNEGEGILLIFDNAANADAVRAYLPRSGGCQVLITSNAQAWRGIAAPLEIRVWPTTVGADYLRGRTGQECEAAEALSEALGGLPLAHEQAAAYCERLERPLADYLKRFAATPAKLLDDPRDAPAEYHDRLTVTKTFALAIAEAARLHRAAAPLITHAALLAAEPIPLFLLEEAHEELGVPLAEMLADDGLDEAIAALRAFALIDRETIVDERDPAIRTETIRLHRLVRQVAAEGRDGEARAEAQRALTQAVAAVYPRQSHNNPQAWPRARRLDAHALALVGVDAGAVQEAGGLLHGLASYRHWALGSCTQARPLYERALALRQKAGDQAETAQTLDDLALLLKDEGDLAGARQLHEQALAMREQMFGREHLVTAESLSNLSLLLWAQGDLTAARSLAERVLAIHEAAFGTEHSATATSYNNLALLMQAQGELAGARPLLERALAIYERTLGDHPSTSVCIANLAFVVATLGELAAARPLYERARAMNERIFGPEHPETATACLNLAGLLHDAGELAAARLFYERGLTIREKTLGRDHPLTGACLNNFAALLQDQSDFAVAQPLNARALAIFQAVHGEADPNTNRARYRLARALLANGAPADALQHAETALAAHANALGADDVWTKDSARVAADALAALGRAEEAATLRQSYGLARNEG
jgi:TIR domain/Tetratricopeptide repeat